ncbi:probable serine/threonine-protein kinase PBL20 [Durio zibethinus]|uniref:Probable serine/threonine-protein kinase PBL20 n=1 Tax=Durio zibethinus TaxID=66656 RepID=A0A6P5ZTM7_DURZI|nr:probable serine/threonine-protein kinase PBL20 [Durio zibethinus]
MASCEAECQPMPLSRTERPKVALGASRGLHQNNIIHKDIRPSNILLNHGFEPLLGDFGIETMRSDDQNFQTSRYLAPEYLENGTFSTQIDVYSFDVVLLELITGQRTMDKKMEQKGFLTWVVSTLEYTIESKPGSLNEDHRPLKSYLPYNCVKTVEQESWYEDIDITSLKRSRSFSANVWTCQNFGNTSSADGKSYKFVRARTRRASRVHYAQLNHSNYSMDKLNLSFLSYCSCNKIIIISLFLFVRDENLKHFLE